MELGIDPNVERYDPDLWIDEFAFFLVSLGQETHKAIPFYDYRSNVDTYPSGRSWMREKKPRAGDSPEI